MADESLPQGGITQKKYAAVCLALAMARGALYAVTRGEDLEEVRYILDITSTVTIAKALDLSESDLTIVWDEHLSPEEINRIKGWG